MRSTHAVVTFALVLAAFGCDGQRDDGNANDRGSDTGSSAARVTEPAPVPVYEERVGQILTKMGERLRAEERFVITAEATVEEFISSGQAIELSIDVTASVRRPDGIRVDRVTDDDHRRAYFDGKRVVLVDVDRNLYASREMTGTIEQLLETAHRRLGVVLPLADLVVKDADEALSESADWGTYLGIHRVRGVKCHHLALANDSLEWQVWVQAEGDPLPRRLVIIYKDEPGRPRFTAHLTRWDLSAEVPDETFSFRPPEGAVEIELEEDER